MSPLRNLCAGLRALFEKKQVEREMEEELNGYLDAAVQDKMRSGMSQEEALRVARVEMGSMDSVKEEIRSAGWESTLETLWQDIRYGLRMLVKSPSFTAVAVLTLALGIGANTAMFSIVDGAFLKPLPVSDPSQFVGIGMRDSHGVFSGVSYPDFLDLRTQSTSLSGAVAYERESRFVNSMDESSLVAVDVVSLNYFDVLGVKPLLGRTFPAAQGSAASEPTVVISYALWKNRLGGDPAIVRKTIRLNNQLVTVLGVGPPRFRGLV